jgi:ribosome-associated toxin RatA of RatAB toxin-antitoxin module
MPQLNDRMLLAHPLEKVFDVAIDIQKYPDILPYIHAVEILSRETGRIEAKITLGVKHVNFSYVCEVSHEQNALVTVRSVSPVFKLFTARCAFERAGENQTMIVYEMDARFHNKILDAAARALLPRQSKVTLRAFSDYLDKL